MDMDRYDTLAIVGALVMAAGVGLIYVPAGLIVLGLVLAATGILGARIRARK